jgi:diketogulonate reductase-like aldo/keto reductase
VIAAGGAEIPQIGLGTWQLRGEVLERAIAAAAEAGYRHFDTAPRYENESEVGHALRATGLARDAYFLTTKVWYTELSAAALRASAEASLDRLGLGPVDLLLVHWPNPEVPLEETIGALCEAHRAGLARHVGVSNFPAALLERAIALADVPLVADQCEYHPRLDQTPLLDCCRRNGVAFVAYAPIGSGRLIADPSIRAIAERHHRSPAQIVLRWHLEQGVVAIPRSSDPTRIAENIAITDFTLTPAERAAIASLAVPDGRIFSPAWVRGWE